MTAKFFDICKARKRKGYQVRTGATLACELCTLFKYDPENPSQRMASVGVCHLDNTPALTFASCSKFVSHDAQREIEQTTKSQEELAELMNMGGNDEPDLE